MSEYVDFANAVMHATDSFLFIATGLFLFAWGQGWIKVSRR